MPLIVRDATPADVLAISDLYATEVREHVNTYEYDVPDEAEMAQRMRAVLDGGYPYLVAELDGQFAGYAYASSYRARIGYRKTVENSVYVVPGLKGRGIGAALMQALIDACEARGYRQMIAVIGEPTNTASIRLHEKFGFTLIGIFRGIAWKHGRWLDTVQMQRTLGAGTDAPPQDE
ncbi:MULTISPECIES: GNAT family N-acetyltransferase [unclassified Pseudoxanthomonas]|uniref:GNAT family N-acetyltransferase n=1 Tax=unclassified Pseudoxanthomonas TaxID=2645906 RepID=UPI0008DF4392|nr:MULTISPECIES: GNAT family N-acetyltransferase [unclassified Pseudoxanthomonas]PPJ42800.1 N-acetyltransferase [Pseudoxanthomonas sp. KAs_5_3]SFV26274.1 phosphinothricin acetyltransferase [Pseudoxanthomonas sp. YR558]